MKQNAKSMTYVPLRYPGKTEAAIIRESIIMKLIPLKFYEKILLARYVQKGKNLQKKVKKILIQNKVDVPIRIDLVTSHVMDEETYFIFYKNHFLKENTNFCSIEDYAEKIKQILKNDPIPKAIYD